MKSNLDENKSLACDLTAIPAAAREEHLVSAPQLIETTQEVRELSNGYALRFANEPGKFLAIAKYIENEQMCCAFFDFALEVEANGGPLWLRLTGGEGVKDLLRATLLEDPQQKTRLKELIRTGGETSLDQMVAQTTLPDLSARITKPDPAP